ncbi:hypothetical protein H5397_12520 [Propioniciclava sp. MC1683]|uniref:hypothetical protein n=1 Tax=Propioniciclava sp. MC1683 TaxID=2760309 RepID=UPI00160023ED|nr:hypothetical protein [Propioniciclava sp. MC1683]MBB1502239.1 hypothetical protein [Propioniciclava sp. MC1683]
MRHTSWPGAALAVVLALAGCAAPATQPAPGGTPPQAAPDSSVTPSPSPAAASPVPTPTHTDWPGPATTGVPEGTTLTPYTGPCTIDTAGTVIDAKVVDCRLRIRTTDVVITRSRINGNVSVREPEDGSFTITDSEVHAGDTLDTGLGNGSFTARRVEVTGGRRSAFCEADCLIEDSWFHAQAGDPEGQAHLSAVRMGRNTTLRGNLIVCDAPRTPPESGCSAGLTGYGGTAPVENNLIEDNYFAAGTSTFCAYGGSSESKEFADGANRIRFVGNVFERGPNGRCGNLGTVASFDPDAPGNEWRDNVWSDGGSVQPD